MYKVQDVPVGVCKLRTGVIVYPEVTLKDEEYGGIAHIIEEDNCYVLVVGSDSSEFFRTKFWFAEAIEALKKMSPLAPM